MFVAGGAAGRRESLSAQDRGVGSRSRFLNRSSQAPMGSRWSVRHRSRGAARELSDALAAAALASRNHQGTARSARGAGAPDRGSCDGSSAARGEEGDGSAARSGRSTLARSAPNCGGCPTISAMSPWRNFSSPPSNRRSGDPPSARTTVRYDIVGAGTTAPRRARRRVEMGWRRNGSLAGRSMDGGVAPTAARDTRSSRRSPGGRSAATLVPPPAQHRSDCMARSISGPDARFERPSRSLGGRRGRRWTRRSV
jgi:hypothetical protein